MTLTSTRTENPRRSEISRRIERVFREQQQHRYQVAATSTKERIAKLKSLRAMIDRNKERIREAHYADFKKPAPEADLSEILAVRMEINHAIKHLKKWMKPRRVKPTLVMVSTSAWIQYQPRGVVLIISPWNFPFNLTIGPMVAAIGAGNCLMLKPSEYTPHTAALMKEMLEELFPENEVALFEGDRTVAEALLKKPFNHIFFTGSPGVGKIVMKAAAENLSTVTLELGGKSPVIVDRTADIPDAAAKIAWGKYLNCGQTCIAPDYLFVHESQYTNFLEALKKYVCKYYGASEAQRQHSPDYARIISPGHLQRLQRMIEESLKKGAKIEFGGITDASDNYVEPTILSDVSPDFPVMQEEIFGPLLPVIDYRDLDEVLAMIQSGPSPLALYIFSRNRKMIRKVLSNTAAGGSCINDVVVHFMHINLPFGGINHSGFGNSHGFYGFKAFSHERAILKHHQLSPFKLLFPPYTAGVKKLIDLMVKSL